MELHQQQQRRKNRIEELYEFIKSNQPAKVSKISIRFSSVSSKTLKEYLKILFDSNKIKVNQYGQFIINKIEKDL